VGSILNILRRLGLSRLRRSGYMMLLRKDSE
jgi:hypothetical protein